MYENVSKYELDSLVSNLEDKYEEFHLAVGNPSKKVGFSESDSEVSLEKVNAKSKLLALKSIINDFEKFLK